jgi:endo-1,4-beta-xylanase
MALSLVASGCASYSYEAVDDQVNSSLTLGQRASEIGFYVGGISGDRLDGSSVIVDSAFADSLTQHFNAVTVENALKWAPLSSAPGEYDFERADQVVDFAEANGLRVRGHTLIWARINGQPRWLEDEVQASEDPAARLREVIEEHVATVMGRYRGRIPVWDVVNEPMHLFGPDLDPQSLFTQVLGPAYIDIAFRAARRADPDALLAMNETLVINNDAKFGALLFLVWQLKAQGTPIDMVGLQGQFILSPPPSRSALRAKLEALASLGVSVEITELGIPIGFYKDEPDALAAQAAAYADIFGACLDVPACSGVTTWGVYDGETWLDDFFPWLKPARPLLLDENYKRKPAYDAVLKLLTDYEGPPRSWKSQ